MLVQIIISVAHNFLVRSDSLTVKTVPPSNVMSQNVVTSPTRTNFGHTIIIVVPTLTRSQVLILSTKLGILLILESYILGVTVAESNYKAISDVF